MIWRGAEEEIGIVYEFNQLDSSEFVIRVGHAARS